MFFNDYLRARSKELGLNQTDIANRLGVSKQAVSKWFNGQATPDKGLLPGLANTLKIDMTELTSRLFGEAGSAVVPAARAKPKKKNVYKLCSAPDLMSAFPQMGFSQEAGKTFRISCDEDTIDLFMDENAEKNGIKLIYPKDKKEKIIKERSAGWRSYEKEELFDFFLDDCLKKYRSDLLVGGNRKYYSDAVRSVIISKYKKILTFDKFQALMELSGTEYDAYHKELCVELVAAEKAVIEDPIFDGDVSYEDKYAFFNAQYAVNTLAAKAVEYELFDDYRGFVASFAREKLHAVIEIRDLNEPETDLKTYDGYITAQEKLKPNGRIRRSVRKNPLNYSSIDEYMETLDGLSTDELLNELWRCKDLNDVINKDLRNAGDSVKEFKDNDFSQLYHIGGMRQEDTFKYEIRKEERNNNYTGCEKLFKEELKRLFDKYKHLNGKIIEYNDYGNGKTFTGNAPEGDIKLAIKIECLTMLGLSGCYTNFRSLVNDLGVHVCSWYYHLTGEVLEPAQTNTSEEAKNMLFRFKDDGSISYSGTVDLMKEEFEKMLVKTGLYKPRVKQNN